MWRWQTQDLCIQLACIHACIHTYIPTCILTYLPCITYETLHHYNTIHAYITYLLACLLACLHACIHASTHTHIHTYIHTYLPTYIRTYIQTYMHTYRLVVASQSHSEVIDQKRYLRRLSRRFGQLHQQVGVDSFSCNMPQVPQDFFDVSVILELSIANLGGWMKYW